MTKRKEPLASEVGLEAVSAVFGRVRAEGRAAFMPYFTLGYPTLETSLDIIEGLATSADLIELGVPFSDPLADGPTIQHSSQIALENGVTLKTCLESVRELRGRGVDIPLMLMSYVNPVLAYGVARFAADAAEAGASGFIVPDLPPEEADELSGACDQHGLALVYLLAPTSTDERVGYVASRSTGFVYLVSLTGVTGARDSLPADLEAFVGRVRAATDKPLAVGFGIGTPEQAKLVGGHADGVIVGSALIAAAQPDPGKAISLGKSVHAALSKAR